MHQKDGHGVPVFGGRSLMFNCVVTVKILVRHAVAHHQYFNTKDNSVPNTWYLLEIGLGYHLRQDHTWYRIEFSSSAIQERFIVELAPLLHAVANRFLGARTRLRRSAWNGNFPTDAPTLP